MEAYIKSFKVFSSEHSIWLTGKCSHWTLLTVEYVLSVTHREQQSQNQGGQAPALTSSLSQGMLNIVLSFLTNASSRRHPAIVPLSPSFPHIPAVYPNNFAGLTTLCCNSSFLVLVLNIMEINNRLFPSSQKSLRSSPQSLFFMWNTVISISTPRQVFWASNHSHCLPLDSLQLTQIFHKEFSTAVHLQPLQAWTRHKDDF